MDLTGLNWMWLVFPQMWYPMFPGTMLASAFNEALKKLYKYKVIQCKQQFLELGDQVKTTVRWLFWIKILTHSTDWFFSLSGSEIRPAQQTAAEKCGALRVLRRTGPLQTLPRRVWFLRCPRRWESDPPWTGRCKQTNKQTDEFISFKHSFTKLPLCEDTVMNYYSSKSI